MRRRFFVEKFESGGAALRGESAEHLGRVLRAEPGQLYELSDGAAVWLSRVEKVSRDAVEFALVERVAARESHLHVTLLLSIVKFDRFEWCLEKATELGVSEIVPLAAARSEKRLVEAAGKRAARWERILVESAQQARRVAVPVLRSVVRAGEAFADARERSKEVKKSGSKDEEPVRLMLSEREGAGPLRLTLERQEVAASGAPTNVVLAIGPEGGWADEEFAAAATAGFAEVSLGANILRTETAVIAALAVVNYALDENQEKT